MPAGRKSTQNFTQNHIQAHLSQLYGIDVSPTLISNVTNRIMPVIKEWQSRPLQRTYAVVFMDAIHYKVKQESHIVNKAPTW